MARLLLRLLLFWIPIGLVLLFPLWVYWEGREFTSVADVVHAQQGSQPILFGLAYSNVTQTYKRALVDSSSAQIAFLGASTGYAFRSTFFTPTGVFISASKAVVGPADFPAFIQQLSPNSTLRVLIVSMEPEFFIPHKTFGAPEQVRPLDRLTTFLLGGWRTPYTDYYFDKKFTLQTLTARAHATPFIGMQALINQSGFLNDGSYLDSVNQDTPQHDQILRQEIIDTVQRLEQDRSSWKYGTSTDSTALANIETFLKLCQERHILVIGYEPPYAQEIYQEMERPNDAYTHEMHALSQTLAAEFARYGDAFFDYTDTTAIGIPDNEFIEEIHPGDKADARILLDMAAHNATLRSYVAVQTVTDMIQHTLGDFIVTHP